MTNIKYTPEEIAEDAISCGVRVVECTLSITEEVYYKYLKAKFFEEKITLELFDDLVKGYTPVADTTL